MDSTNENMYHWSQKSSLSAPPPPPPLPPSQTVAQHHLPMFFDSANISSLGTSSADNESNFNNYNIGGGINNGKFNTGVTNSNSNYLDSGFSTLYGNTKTNNMTNSSYLSNSSSSSSPSLLSPSSSSSFVHNHSNILEPIFEDTEMKSFNQSASELTPNTRNIAKINAFHITSPVACNKMNNNNHKHNGNHDTPSPGKRSACIAFHSNFNNKQQYETERTQSFSIDTTTPAKHRKLVLSNCTNLTPKKSTATILPPSSVALSLSTSKLFQPKLYDIEENPLFVDHLSPFSKTASLNCQSKSVVDSQKDNNSGGDNDKQPIIITINNPSTKNNENLLIKPKRKFQRHHSNISTSTPFAPSCDDLTVSVPADSKRKFNRFRKVQSFSPSKYLKMQQENKDYIERFRPYKNIVSPLPNWSNCVEYQDDNIPQLLTPNKTNPAKKFLEFDHEVFDEIIKSTDVVDAVVPPRHEINRQNAYANIISSSAPIIDEYDLPRDAKHICDVNSSLNLSIIPKMQLDSSIVVHTTFLDDFDENNSSGGISSNHHRCLLPTNKIDLNKSLIFSSLPNNLEPPKTPSPPPPELIPLLSSSADEIIYKTPTKKNQRSSSLYDDYKSKNTKTSPRQEQNKILYSNLPCTPPKSLSIRKFTQHKSRSTSPTNIKKSTPVKRRTLLYNNSLQIADLKRLDIIGHLEGNILAIELILSFLSDRQLLECLTVSKKWKRIIECCPMVAKRMKHYSKCSAVSKENVPLVNADASNDLSDNEVFEINELFTRKPFHNVINWKTTKATTGSRQQNAITSETPKINEFQETQRILQNVSPHARVMKCPRCNRSSIINEKKSNNTENNSLSQLSTSSQNSNTSSSSSKSNNTQQSSSSAAHRRHLFLRSGAQSHENTMNKTKDYSTLPFQKSSSLSLDFDDFSTTTTTNNNDNTFYQLFSKTEPNLYNHNPYHHNNSSMLSSFSSASSLSSTTAAAPSTIITTTEYAQCTNNKCGFCFCIKCLCDARHLNGICSWEAHKQQSEEIEDEQELDNIFLINQTNNNQRRSNNNFEKNTSTKNKLSSNCSSSLASSSSSYVACSKQSKRNLRRLCSLEN